MKKLIITTASALAVVALSATALAGCGKGDKKAEKETTTTTAVTTTTASETQQLTTQADYTENNLEESTDSNDATQQEATSADDNESSSYNTVTGGNWYLNGDLTGGHINISGNGGMVQFYDANNEVETGNCYINYSDEGWYQIKDASDNTLMTIYFDSDTQFHTSDGATYELVEGRGDIIE